MQGGGAMARRAPAKRATKRYFGNVRELPSGRFQARYTGPDGLTYTARTPQGRPLTFDTKGDAEAWLTLRHSEVLRGAWLPPAEQQAAPVTVRKFSTDWLAERDLQTRTREHYQHLLDSRILPAFGDTAVASITPAMVRTWHAEQGKGTPTSRAHAYALLRTILGTAVSDDVIAANPCRIRGAGQSKPAKKTRPATLEELGAIVAALPERYRMMAQLACWCSLRFGELSGLQRGDIDLKAGVLRVRRGVVRTKDGLIVKTPKSAAGVRDVTIPSHIVDDLREHLKLHAQPGATGLVFPSATGGHMPASALHRVFGPARAGAGRPDLSFHDLRHTGQTYAAAAGANLRELMARAGQSTPGAALRYLHEMDGRQREIADRLATFAGGGGNVTPIASRAPRKAAAKRASRRGTGS